MPFSFCMSQKSFIALVHNTTGTLEFFAAVTHVAFLKSCGPKFFQALGTFIYFCVVDFIIMLHLKTG